MRQSDEDRDKRQIPHDDVAYGDIVPRPDPTTLTTRQLEREIAALSEIFEAKLRALTERVNTFETGSKEALVAAAQNIQTGLDKAEKSIVVSIDKVQSEQRNALTDAEKRVNEKFEGLIKSIDEKFSQHRVVDDEKFRSIEVQFVERDRRTEQLSLADKTAIAAALQAQKEAAGATNESNAAAISKSESAFTKQIDQIYTLVASTTKSTDDKINDLKSRLDRGEGKTVGTQETKTEQRDNGKYLIAVLGLLLAILAFIVGKGGLH